jgi:hypothetical protein
VKICNQNVTDNISVFSMITVRSIEFIFIAVNTLITLKMSFSVLYWLSCLPLDLSFVGSNPAEDYEFLRAIKIDDLLRRGSKAVGPMS